MKRKVAGVLLLMFWIAATARDTAIPDGEEPMLDSVDLTFEADAKMQQFLQQAQLPAHLPDIHKARRIVQLLFAEASGGFTYDPGLTLTPSEAFVQRRGNCLTFAMLFTTLAREVGLDTRFYELRTAPGWNRSGDLIVETGHVNVVVRSGNRHFVVEWLEFYRELSHLRSRAVSDAKIRSDYFNNLAVQAMAKHDLERATACIERALALDSSHAGVWQNKGGLSLHQGRPGEADYAFLQGIRTDGGASSSAFLLSKLYAQQGRTQLAERYARIGERHARKNPFYHYQLALEAFDAGQWSQSRRHLHRAIQLLPDYHLFHFLKARCLIESGSIREGQKELELAITQTQSVEVRAKYQRHLDALLSVDSSGTSGT